MKKSKFFDIHRINLESFQNRKNQCKKQFLIDIFIPNDRIYEDLKIIRFYPKTPGNRDSGHQKCQVFHADACVRCCAGSRGFPPHGAKHSLCSLALGWPPAENRGSATLPPKINLSLIFQSC